MNTANRVLWIVLGVVLLALGVFGTLASLGRLSWLPSSTTLLPTSLNADWHRYGFWAPLVAIVVGVVLVVLGALLLRAELRRRTSRPMPMLVLPSTTTPGGGSTFVGSDTLEKALSRDLARSRYLTGASAYLTGEPARPTVALRLAVTPGANLTQVKHVVDGALHRFAATSGVTPRVSDVDVKISSATAATRRADRSRVT